MTSTIVSYRAAAIVVAYDMGRDGKFAAAEETDYEQNDDEHPRARFEPACGDA